MACTESIDGMLSCDLEGLYVTRLLTKGIQTGEQKCKVALRSAMRSADRLRLGEGNLLLYLIEGFSSSGIDAVIRTCPRRNHKLTATEFRNQRKSWFRTVRKAKRTCWEEFLQTCKEEEQTSFPGDTNTPSRVTSGPLPHPTRSDYDVARFLSTRITACQDQTTSLTGNSASGSC